MIAEVELMPVVMIPEAGGHLERQEVEDQENDIRISIYISYFIILIVSM